MSRQRLPGWERLRLRMHLAAKERARETIMARELVFQNGRVRMPNGTMGDVEKSKTTLSSNGRTIYTTIKWTTGVLSCDCPGWAIRKGDGDRVCKHTKASVRCNCSDMSAAGTQQVQQTVARPAAPPVAPGRRTLKIRN